ncbi:cobalt ECF transporter T component CbiQ [Kribbia dieselivorans]|uniref:cobalt ECF transporter T component CbiQ n=1 Tax=Kribbia dieselivorans TaxID=331526 RepID=UPI000837AE24|nr:cobalt ECF transporter T component CbiQ [Kribbia dieselivorans]
MATLRLDDAAWNNRWRGRSTAEKVVLSAGLVAVALTAPGPAGGVIVLVVASLLACLWARVPVRTWSFAIAAPAVFIVLGTIGIVVTFGEPVGRVVVDMGPASVTQPSLWAGAVVALRALASAAAVMLLAATTPMPYLLASLGRVWGLRTLTEIATLVYRMIFSLLESQARIRETQTARLGYGSARTAIRSVGMLGAGTFIRAWTHSRRLGEGLAGRGYDGAWFALPSRRPVSGAFVAVALAIVAVCAGVSLVGPRWPV